MVIKVKEYFEKTRKIENTNNFKKYTLRGQRDARYHDRILSDTKKSNKFNFISDSTSSYNFTTSSVQKSI